MSILISVTDAWSALLAAPVHSMVFACASVLVGYFVLGLVGFGSALIAIPLLSWQWPLTVVVPLMLMIDVAASALHTGLNLRHVAWREIPPLAPGVMIGCATALLLLKWIEGPWLLVALGAYVVVVGWRGLRGVSGPSGSWPPAAPAGRTRAVMAFFMGLVETLYGTAGPVVVAWLSRRVNDVQALRATVPTTIVLISLIALVGAGAAGYLSQPLVMGALLPLLPLALCSVALGHWCSARVPAAMLRRVTYSLLIASGVALGGRAIWQAVA